MKTRYQTINNASTSTGALGLYGRPHSLFGRYHPQFEVPLKWLCSFNRHLKSPGLNGLPKKQTGVLMSLKHKASSTSNAKPLLAFRSSLSSDMHTGCGSSARTWFDWGRGRSVSIGVVSSGRWENGRIEVGAAGRGLGVDFMIFHRLMKARERDLEGAE